MTQVALKSVVGKQIPEFIRSDYPLFVEFFKAYYEYLQNQKIDVAAIRDVDETFDSFIQYFRKELDVLGTKYPFINERLFLRNSKEWFTSKGAEASYKLLFKMYYGYNAEIKYPWDQVLKASDGEWKQDYSLFVNITSGNASDLVGNHAYIIGSNTKIRVFCSFINPIQETITTTAAQLVAGQTYTISSVGTTDFKAAGASDNLVGIQFVATGTASGTGTATYYSYTQEIFIDKNYYGNIEIGDELQLVQKVVSFDAIVNVNITNSTLTIVDHGLTTGDNVTYSYTGGLGVGGLGTSSSYYIIVVDKDHIKLAITYENAIDPNAVDTQLYNVVLSGAGIGVAHQLTKAVRGTILPTGSSYKISKPGSGFSIGSLVKGVTVSGGKVITQLMKVTRVDENGGIISVDNIRFGYGYANNFFILAPSPKLTQVSSSLISTVKATVATASSGNWSVSGSTLTVSSSDLPFSVGMTLTQSNPANNDIKPSITQGSATQIVVGTKYIITSIGTTDFTALGAASNTIGITFTATAVGTGTGTVAYTSPNVVYGAPGSIIPGTTITAQLTSTTFTLSNSTCTTGSVALYGTAPATPQFTLPNDSLIDYYEDYGYIINPNYWKIEYSDISYVATLISEFYNTLKTQLGTSVDFALISFTRGAVAKYPGHYSSNHGFLNDDIFIQDSYKYQKFSYVVSVTAMLETYRSIVKAYLHPAGTALFGEYRIDNGYTLNITHSQVLSQWISQATYTNINKDISIDYAWFNSDPALGRIAGDIGGWFRMDPYDSEQYVEAIAGGSIYNPPITGKTQTFSAT
jgi:hypothetical protein